MSDSVAVPSATARRYCYYMALMAELPSSPEQADLRSQTQSSGQNPPSGQNGSAPVLVPVGRENKDRSASGEICLDPIRQLIEICSAEVSSWNVKRSEERYDIDVRIATFLGCVLGETGPALRHLADRVNHPLWGCVLACCVAEANDAKVLQTVQESVEKYKPKQSRDKGAKQIVLRRIAEDWLCRFGDVQRAAAIVKTLSPDVDSRQREAISSIILPIAGEWPQTIERLSKSKDAWICSRRHNTLMTD